MGDGADDLAIGSTTLGTRVISVTTGATLAAIPATGPIDDAGDHNGDGVPDILIGGKLYSGAGALLLDLGWPYVRTGPDFDGDGITDFVAGEPTFDDNRGRAAILSGADASVLTILIEGSAADDYAGHEVDVVGDINGDGSAELIVGAPFAGELDQGAAHLVAGYCRPAPTNYCVGAPNSAGGGAEMGFEGSWNLSGAGFALVAEACPPNHFGLFFYSTTQAQSPFGNGWLCVAPAFYRLWPAVDTGSFGRVVRSLDFDEPPLASGAGMAAPGVTLNFQFWFRDVPAGGAFFNLSDGLSVTFCP